MQTPSLIAHTPPNILIREAALKVADAIDALSENGFNVIKVELESPARPTIHIQTCRQCQTLIQRGEAVYYSFGKGEHFGLYRQGQFRLGGCRVVWTEFGH